MADELRSKCLDMCSSILWLGTPCACAPRGVCFEHRSCAEALQQWTSPMQRGFRWKEAATRLSMAASHHKGRKRPVACARTCCTARARNAIRHALCLVRRRCLGMVLVGWWSRGTLSGLGGVLHCPQTVVKHRTRAHHVSLTLYLGRTPHTTQKVGRQSGLSIGCCTQSKALLQAHALQCLTQMSHLPTFLVWLACTQASHHNGIIIIIRLHVAMRAEPNVANSAVMALKPHWAPNTALALYRKSSEGPARSRRPTESWHRILGLPTNGRGQLSARMPIFSGNHLAHGGWRRHGLGKI